MEKPSPPWLPLTLLHSGAALSLTHRAIGTCRGEWWGVTNQSPSLQQVPSCPAGSERYLESRDASRLSGRDPSSWTVEDVMQFVREADPQLGPHADLFRKHVGAPA